ncbi:hypothetical protein WK77_16300 [Burkholderia ubonensis]|nr:hypothetical protein WK77_16300 [Burkholderia ubonensis]
MKKLAANGAVKKVDKFRAPIGMIHVREDNIRRADAKENIEHVHSIYKALEVQFKTDLELCTEEGPRKGSMQLKKGVALCVHDIVVAVDENDHISSIDGNSSTRALKMHAAEGVYIDDRFLVDVVTRNVESREQIIVMMIRSGMAKNPSPLEFGLAFKELRDGVDGGERWSIKDIAQEFDRTEVSVRTLLKLADADPRIHALIDAGTVSSSVALDAVLKHGDDAYSVLSADQKEVLETQGRTRVTQAAVKGRALPGKLVTSAIETIEALTSRIDHKTRVELANLENLDPERIKGKKIELDADLVLALVKAGGQIKDQRDRQAELAREKQAAAAQTSIDQDGAPDDAREAA